MKQSNSHSDSLAGYFPMIRTRQEILQTITRRADLNHIFQQWNKKYQDDFIDSCTGTKGMKVLYDGFFKEIFNPETVPERLEALLSTLLGRQVRIQSVLPNDSVRLGAESSLLYTDIIVQLEDGSLSDIEIQKIGYKFPGQRAACYSADHLLRQYKRVHGRQGKRFSYHSIKSVYTIVFFETSPKEFKPFGKNYLHYFHQQSNTELKLDLLQEFIFISLDNFKKIMDNKDIETDLEAWLSFLSFDDPKRIIELFTYHPQFKSMYQEIYMICRNTEEVMNMYSKELAELDRNTVRLMMDEMQDEIDQIKAERKAESDSFKAEIDQVRAENNNIKNELFQKQQEIESLKKELAQLKSDT